MNPIDRANSQLHLLAGAIRVLPAPDVLLRVFLKREVEHSSRIENTIASARELALFDVDQDDARDEVREVHANLVALLFGCGSALPLSLRLIREMHAKLLSGVRGEDKRPGQFRSGQVYIGSTTGGLRNARFVPPPPGSDLEQCLRDYEQFLNPDERRPRRHFPPLVELALGHYQFECIHPFADGNGRMGRLLITLTGLKAGWLEFPLPYISPFLDRHRQEYCDLMLRVSTHGDWEAWIEFFCRAVEVECADGMKRVRAIDRLRSVYRERAQRAGRSNNLVRLADLLFVQQAVTATWVRRLLEISQPSAQGLIERLVDAGILTEATGRTYKRVYVADEIIRLIESDDPDSLGHPQVPGTP
ncbi:MAG: Fic family protein [Phycisphaeraceae bacterium]|nr:Fic family protein [Phycisphaeraceae bacterium]